MQHVAVTMRADRGTGKYWIFERADLLQVATGAVGHQADGAEALVRRAHHFAEYGSSRRVVEILKNDDRRPRQLRELIELCSDAAIRVATGWWRVAPERRCAGETHNRRQLRKITLDPGIHIAAIPRPDVEQLDKVADRRRIEFRKLAERLFGNRHGSKFRNRVQSSS